jgi:VWFA-related protein
MPAGLLFTTFLAAAAAGQIAPQPAAQVPVFRAATRLVQVSVVVHDGHGQPVADLKKDEFTLTERGKPQQISFFSVASSASPASPPPPLPPHVFSNVLTQQAGVPPSVTIVLLDLLNTSWTDQIYARKALVRFLEQIQPQDRLAILTLGGGRLTVLHDYTTDASSLVAKVAKFRAQLLPELEASTVNPDSQQALADLGLDSFADADQRMADFYGTGRVVNTLQALQAIAEHLTSLPGRKNLIWLSGGFPLTIGFDEMPEIGSTRDQRTFTAEMDAAVRALNDSGVAVYPVDARGLMTLPGFDASSRGTASARGPSPGARLGPIVANQETMRELADRTGGRAAYNTNDLARALRRAVDDSLVTYTLGYYSSDEAQDGKFRDIKIKVNRPHVDVRYRKGYFAFKPSDTGAQRRKEEMHAAVWSPLDATAIVVNARVDFLDKPDPNTVNVIVQIDPATIRFAKDGDRWKADLDIVYVQKDEQGATQRDGVAETISLALTQETYTRMAERGLIHQRSFPRQPGAVTLRIVVRQVSSGATGSLTIPFNKVPYQPPPPPPPELPPPPPPPLDPPDPLELGLATPAAIVVAATAQAPLAPAPPDAPPPNPVQPLPLDVPEPDLDPDDEANVVPEDEAPAPSPPNEWNHRSASGPSPNAST